MANGNAVFSGWLLQTVHPFTLLFWSFLATSLFFFLQLSLTQGFQAVKIPRQSIFYLVILNISSSLSWIGYFYALRYIEPAIVSALMGGIGPLFIVCTNFIALRVLSLNQIITSVGVLAGVIVLSWASLSEQSAIQNVSFHHVIVGLSAALVGGLGQVLTTVSTKSLAEQNWNASQIMAHRFYLLTIVAACFALNGPGIFVTSVVSMAGITIATIFGVLLPLWLLQKGIILSTAFTVSVLLSLGPLITLLFQGLDSRLLWSNLSIVGCSIIVLSTINNFIQGGVWQLFLRNPAK